LRRRCERGLTKRQPSPVDGRATHASLTASGREAITQAAHVHIKLVEHPFFDAIPDELLAPLTAALEHADVN
jgi:DNA-binding MarR family transcriptional regulator